MSEVLRPWLLKYIHRLADSDAPNDSFEDLRKKVQITKFYTDGAQPLKSGELWAQVSDKERWINVLICPSSVEKHKATHNGERITQVKLGNFFVTKCRPILAQTPFFNNNGWSLTPPSLCLEAEVEFIGGRGCGSVHGDPVEAAADPRVREWENKLRTQGFNVPADEQSTNIRPGIDAGASAGATVRPANDVTAERQSTSPRSTTIVEEPGPWQAHLLRLWGTTELKWPSNEIPDDQRQVLDKITDEALSASTSPSKSQQSPRQPTASPSVAQQLDADDATQDFLPWSPSPPRRRRPQEMAETEGAEQQPVDGSSHEGSQLREEERSDAAGMGEEGDEDGEGSAVEEEEEEAEADGLGSNGEEAPGLSWDKDEDDADLAGTQTPASLEAVEDVLGTQVSDDDEDPNPSTQGWTPFLPSSSMPSSPLHVAAEMSPSSTPSASAPNMTQAAHIPTSPSQRSTPVLASSSNVAGGAQDAVASSHALPPSSSPLVSGQHDRESWTQPSFLRRAQSVSTENRVDASTPATAQAGPSNPVAALSEVEDPHYRDKHDRQGFLAAGLGTEEDWEAEEAERQRLPTAGPKQALRSEWRSDPNARQTLQERIQAASEEIRNGKRRAPSDAEASSNHQAKRRLTGDRGRDNRALSVPAIQSQTSNSTNGRTPGQAPELSGDKTNGVRRAARKTVQAQSHGPVAPAVTGDQIPMVRAALRPAITKGKGKRASPFESSSDDDNNGTAKKRVRTEAEDKRAEARFRFAKADPSGRHVSPTQRRTISQIEIAHEVAVGLSRRSEDVAKEQAEGSPSEQTMHITNGNPPTDAPPTPPRPVSSTSAHTTVSSSPRPSITVGLGIKTSPVHIERAYLTGRSPKRKEAGKPPTGPTRNKLLPAAPPPPPAPVVVQNMQSHAVADTEDVEMGPPDTDDIQPLNAPPAHLAGPVPNASTNTKRAAEAPSEARPTIPVVDRPPPALLRGFMPVLTLDPNDTALCKTLADLGQLLQEIDEYRNHGY